MGEEQKASNVIVVVLSYIDYHFPIFLLLLLTYLKRSHSILGNWSLTIRVINVVQNKLLLLKFYT